VLAIEPTGFHAIENRNALPEFGQYRRAAGGVETGAERTIDVFWRPRVERTAKMVKASEEVHTGGSLPDLESKKLCSSWQRSGMPPCSRTTPSQGRIVGSDRARSVNWKGLQSGLSSCACGVAPRPTKRIGIRMTTRRRIRTAFGNRSLSTMQVSLPVRAETRRNLDRGRRVEVSTTEAYPLQASQIRARTWPAENSPICWSNGARAISQPSIAYFPTCTTSFGRSPAVAILDRALALLIDALERRRFARVISPQPSPRESAPSGRHIPAAVRRAGWQRDEGRCGFVGRAGRCRETAFLEFHHVAPYAAGGSRDGGQHPTPLPRTTSMRRVFSSGTRSSASDWMCGWKTLHRTDLWRTTRVIRSKSTRAATSTAVPPCPVQGMATFLEGLSGLSVHCASFSDSVFDSPSRS
jgi:hypothetical protein